MELALHRTKLAAKATLGHLEVDGAWECVTLEDRWRKDPNPATPANEAKVYGETCIPAGRYRVVIDMSPKFQRLMMHILEVPGFTGIRIHSANSDRDLLGCVGVGEVVVNDDWIQGGSRACPKLQTKVQDAQARGEEIWINITDDFLDQPIGSAHV